MLVSEKVKKSRNEAVISLSKTLTDAMESQKTIVPIDTFQNILQIPDTKK